MTPTLAGLLMIPLVDTHCHLLAGLDDGPGTLDEALEMCRIAWEEGTRAIAATAHLNGQWPEVTPHRIRIATRQLISRLKEVDLPLTIYPSAEVTVQPNLEDLWVQGELLSVADRGVYLLIEFPPGIFVDLCDLVRDFRARDIRPILAHPERHPELLYDAGVIEQLIGLGCLVQVSSDSITNPWHRDSLRVLKRWVQRGVVHLVGSDGHSTRVRTPRMAEAYRCVAHWAGGSVADRICGMNGLAVLEGLPLRIPKPQPPRKSWFSRLR